MQTRIAPNRRLTRSLSIALALALSVILSGAISFSASAQERARDFISPRLSRTQFQQFVQKLNLGSDQRQIATMAFTDYESTLAELANRLDAEALAVGRQKVDDSLSGKARMAAEDLQRLRAEVYRVYLQVGSECDAALDMLLGGLEVILLDEQFARFDEAMKWLNREILLLPRADSATSQEYAGDGVDVLRLVEEACADDGELSGMDAAAFDVILNRYADELDDVLRATASANRDGAMRRKIASIENDAETLKREEGAAVGRWRALYDLNAQTVQQVADVAHAAIGPQASELFLQRFDRACFTWLYPRKKPDRQIEWIRERSDIDPKALAEAEAVYAGYIAKRNALSRKAIDMMLKARFEFQTFLYALMERSSIDERIRTLFTDLIKNTGEQSTLDAATESQIEALLSEQVRGELRSAMRRPDRPARPPGAPGR